MWSFYALSEASLSQHLHMFNNLEALPTPTLESLMESSSHDPLLTPFPAPLPSLEIGGGDEHPKLLVIASVFLVPSSLPGVHPESPL